MNPETQKKHLRFLSSGTNIFYYLWVKEFFDIRREIHLTFPSAPTTCAPVTRPRRASESHSFFFGWQDSTNWLFSKIPKILPVRDAIHIHWSTFLSGIFILTSVNDTSSPCERQHMCSSLYLSNPCTEPKISQPNKPKGKVL